MEPRKSIPSLHKDYVVTSLRREMVSFQQLMDTLENSDQYEVDYIEKTLKVIETRLRTISRSLSNYN